MPLREVGWVQEVIVNKVTGLIVDGHLRVTLVGAQNGRVEKAINRSPQCPPQERRWARPAPLGDNGSYGRTRIGSGCRLSGAVDGRSDDSR